MADDAKRQAVRTICHELVTGEAQQFDNIVNKKPRTDEGYQAHLDKAVEAIITALRS